MTMKSRRARRTAPALLPAALLFAACDVDSTTIDSSGLPLDPAPQAEGASGAPALRGFAVVNSDYQSVSVSLMDLDGAVLSETFVASGSAPVGLSAPLDDVVTPSAVIAGDELVLINRTPAAFLTWLDLETAEVRAQLNVETGFASNPHDYIQVASDKAYVTRHAPNLASGNAPFDGGNDVLIIDPRQPEIIGRIDLMGVLDGEPEGFYPRAGRALMAGGQLHVLALGFDETFDAMLDSRIVSIDPETDEITQVLVLRGQQNCQSLSLSPAGTELIVGCSGPFGEDAASGFPSSGLVVLSVGETLQEVRRIPASDLGGERVSSLSHASDDSLVLATYGRYDADFGLAAPDAVRRFDLREGSVEAPLHESSEAPFTLGDVRCAPEASACLVADAETEGGVVHHYVIGEQGELTDGRRIKVDRTIGLPPRSIGVF